MENVHIPVGYPNEACIYSPMNIFKTEGEKDEWALKEKANE